MGDEGIAGRSTCLSGGHFREFIAESPIFKVLNHVTYSVR